MPPYSAGYFRPSRPRSPSFLNTSCDRELLRGLPLGDVGVDLLGDEPADGVGDLLVFGGELHGVGLCWVSKTIGRAARSVACMGARRGHIRATPKVLGRSARASASRASARHSASTRRVSRGSMMPSSHSRAVPNSAVDSRSSRLRERVGHRLQRLVVRRRAAALELAAVDDVHHLGRLRAAHHRGARRRPGEDEARVEAAPAHAVVAGAVGAADDEGELRHARVGHRLDHLRAVLDRAAALGHRADHVAGGVLQEDERRAASGRRAG